MKIEETGNPVVPSIIDLEQSKAEDDEEMQEVCYTFYKDPKRGRERGSQYSPLFVTKLFDKTTLHTEE